MRSPAALVAASSRLASLPSVYLRLTETANDPHSSQAALARVIGDDPALAARLLRLVNSALYGPGRTIDTVGDALAFVGTTAVLDLALASSVLRVFAGIPRELVDMEAFWRHSIACAVTARTLAAARPGISAERCFVAGLLHDVGRLVIFLEEPDAAREAIVRARATGRLLHDAERELFGFDHADVGRALAEAWRLPVTLREAVGGHHRPAAAGAIEASVVHIADVIANALELGSAGAPLVPPLDRAAWQRVAIPLDELPAMIEAAESRYNDVVQVMLVYDYWQAQPAAAARPRLVR